MAFKNDNIGLLRLQRERLQMNVIEPLLRIKNTTGRCLLRQEVRTIASFLTEDVSNDTLSEVSDGVSLMKMFDLYYGYDNLKLIEHLLTKAGCQHLVEMLHDWKSCNNNALVPNLFNEFGFFPFWVKVSYNFNEFSKNRRAIFNTIEHVFAIPNIGDGDPAMDPAVYMGISIGKRDVLLCVLVPHCVRQYIEASFKRREVASLLKEAHIIGIYFSRIKVTGIGDSQSSVSSTGTSLCSDFGKLCDAVYEDTSLPCYQDNSTFVRKSRTELPKGTRYGDVDRNGNFIDRDSDEQCYYSNRKGSTDSEIPKLVRACYGHVGGTAQPGEPNAEHVKKPTYGTSFFVDYGSQDRLILESPLDDPSIPRPRAPCHAIEQFASNIHRTSSYDDCYYPEREPRCSRVSRRADDEELYTRGSEGCFEDPARTESDYEQELSSWSKEINGGNGIDSWWYRQQPTSDFTNNNLMLRVPQRTGYFDVENSEKGEYESQPSISYYENDARFSYHGDTYLPRDEQRYGYEDYQVEAGSGHSASMLRANDGLANEATARQSTPRSSMTGWAQINESPVRREKVLISRSMPALYSHDAESLGRGNSRKCDGYEGRQREISKYESQADLEDNVFVETHNNSVELSLSPPPYYPPPDYQQSMIRKSYISLSTVSLDSKSKKVKIPLLSSQSVGSIYKEKELLLSRDELQETIRSAEKKQWEILLEKCKEFLIAAKMGDVEDVKYLLEEDVDVDYKNEFGHTALMVASREGHEQIVQVLVSYRADLNIQDKYGKTALHEAAWSGEHQVIAELVSRGANINCMDEEGRTPLQYAALRGKTKVADILLQLGANVSMMTKEGQSAVELAFHSRHKDIVKLLLQASDKQTRKDMRGQIRKLKIQRIKSATSLPNLTKVTSLKNKRSRSRPELNNRRVCVIQ